MARSEFTLDDFLKMESLWHGGEGIARRMSELSKMIPGLPGLNLGFLQNMEAQVRRSFEIVRHMTPAERKNPALIDDYGRERIAKDAGATPEDVDTLLNAFQDMTEMLRNMADMSSPTEAWSSQESDENEWETPTAINDEWEYVGEDTTKDAEETTVVDSWDNVDWPDAEWDYKPENDQDRR